MLGLDHLISEGVGVLSSAEASKEREREKERQRKQGAWGIHLPRDLRAFTILFPSPTIYLLLSLALQPVPLEKPQGERGGEVKDLVSARIFLPSDKQGRLYFPFQE